MRLVQSYLKFIPPDARPATRDEIFQAGRRNEEVSMAVLKPFLAAARPQAQWVADDQENIALPDGEWWVVDAVEGNVNHVHGLPEWCVSVTLIRDNLPVLTAVYQTSRRFNLYRHPWRRRLPQWTTPSHFGQV